MEKLSNYETPESMTSSIKKDLHFGKSRGRYFTSPKSTPLQISIEISAKLNQSIDAQLKQKQLAKQR